MASHLICSAVGAPAKASSRPHWGGFVRRRDSTLHCERVDRRTHPCCSPARYIRFVNIKPTLRKKLCRNSTRSGDTSVQWQCEESVVCSLPRVVSSCLVLPQKPAPWLPGKRWPA